MKKVIQNLQRHSLENSQGIQKQFVALPICLSASFSILSHSKEGLFTYFFAALTLFIILSFSFVGGVVIYTYTFGLRKLKKKVFPFILSKLKLTGNEKILDLESFRGILPNILAQQISTGKVTTLIRSDNKRVNRRSLKKILKLEKRGEKIKAICCNFKELPFPDDSFDVVTSSLFFHKISETDEEILLEEMLRVLKPKGQFVLFDILSKRARFFNKGIKKISKPTEPEFSSETLSFEYYLKYTRNEKISFETTPVLHFPAGRFIWGENVLLEKPISKPRTLEEVKPPWVVYPDYGPCDGCWRQGGEAWFYHVWQPYWNSLSEKAKKEYLQKFEVPEDWWSMYFDPEHQKWLDVNVPKDSPAGHILRMQKEQ